ncbi:MAG: hypothetical protein OQL09_02715 [Gammaproteobacteria bacterium]|nr:hypothetical protein [Gammaproteobacteria bacterium]
MKDKLFMASVVLVFIVAYVMGQWLSNQQSGKKLPMKIMISEPCDPAQGTCQAKFDKYTLNLEFLDKPSALMPFRVRIESDSEQIDDIALDFKMPGMNMGINRYRLKKDNGYWQNQLVLPVCTLRRNDWLLTVELEQKGILWTSEFRFVNTVSRFN